ncbi:MAG: hypothetical protein J0H15_10295 [Xanthomonadales bacterium]|nr:hypothetical protein [Xanthomonadales bacterium]
MRTLRFRITGDDAGFESVMKTLSGMEHVDRADEVGALMLGMRDDSSSLELSADDRGDVHDVVVHASSSTHAEEVQRVLEARAMELGLAIEFVDRF